MRLFGFLSSILFFVGCSSDKNYNAIVPEDGWTYDHVLEFVIPLESDRPYSLDLEVRHTDDYDYQNLYMIVDLSTKADYRFTDTLSIPLTDSDGFWLGACGRSECTCPYSLIESLSFKEPSIIKANIRQYSRDENLTGIKGVKLILREKD